MTKQDLINEINRLQKLLPVIEKMDEETKLYGMTDEGGYTEGVKLLKSFQMMIEIDEDEKEICITSKIEYNKW